MTKTYSTKRSLLTSVIALMLCFAMLLGTTFAWFTDSVTSSKNIIKSGNIDVEMHWADGTIEVPAEDSADWLDASTEAIFDYDNWEPGYVQVRHIKISNKGSLALKYKVNFIANGEVSELSDVIDVYYMDPAAQVKDRTQLTDEYKLGTLTYALENLPTTGNGTLVSGDSDMITIAFKMQESAGNTYQNMSIGTDFSVQLLATQLASEDDSFGNDYDEDAVYQETISGVVGGGETLTAGGVSITLPATAAKDEYTLKVDNKKVETNANNETTLSLDIELLKNGVKVEAEAGVEYGVAINVGKDLVVTGVTHKGVAVDNYAYNPTTGLVTFKTDSFSPFTVSYSAETFRVKNAEELIAVLSAIKTEAKIQIPNGNKTYRENAVIVLEDDIVIDANTEFMYTDSNGAPLHFYGVKGILDLNGHNITVSSDALLDGKSNANAVLLFQYSNVDIVGEGSIVAQNQSIPVYAWANCSVNIYGGNYVTNASERNESAVYVNNKSALVNVYGGTYTDSAYAFNVHDDCGSTPVIVLHEGITYKDFFKNGTTDVTKSDINNGRIVLAPGCEMEKYEGNMNKIVK